MPRTVYALLSVLVLLAIAAPTVALPPEGGPILNQYVLEAIAEYQDGSYPYLLNDDYSNYNGVTKDILYQGQILLKSNPSGDQASHCVGITFEVLFAAMQARNRQLGLPEHYFNGMGFRDMQDFMLDWYAAKGPKTVSNIGVAVQNYGIGQRIADLESALPGDFIDYMRTGGSGHTAVFLEWVRDDGQIIGFKYWSSQTSTGGIGINTEYFDVTSPSGAKRGSVKYSGLVIVRISRVDEFKSFRINSFRHMLQNTIKTMMQIAGN